MSSCCLAGVEVTCEKGADESVPGVTGRFVQLLAGLVESGSTPELAGGAAEVLAELVAKRMEPLPKIRLIQVRDAP